MKKRYPKTFALILLSATLSLAACGKEPSDKPGGDAKTLGGGIPNAQAGGASQRLDEEGITEEQLGHPLALTGKALGTLPVVGTEDDIYCNLPENQLYQTDQEADILPVCYDPLYDILYYVDYGGDYMIHMIRDGKAELAVELPARKLFCREGRLYFLLDSYGQFAVEGAKSGNILSYNPVDGQINLISDQTFDSIVVYQDLIYCVNISESKVDHGGGRTESVYLYFFNTGELSDNIRLENNDFILDPCGRYQSSFLATTFRTCDISEIEEESVIALYENALAQGRTPVITIGTGKQLCQWDGSEPAILNGLAELEQIPFANIMHYIKGEYLLWFAKDALHSYHIPEQQDEILASIAQGLIYEPPYLFTGERLYLKDGMYLDIADGSTHSGCVLSPDFRFEVDVQRFYTDGENIYAIACTTEKSSGQLYRVNVLTRDQAQEKIQSVIVINELKQYENVLLLAPMDETN